MNYKTFYATLLSAALLTTSVSWAEPMATPPETETPAVENTFIPEEQPVQEESEITPQPTWEVQYATASRLIIRANSTAATFNGSPYTLGVAPKIINDRTYVELKTLVETLVGGELVVTEPGKQLQITLPDRKIILNIGASIITVNGEKKDLGSKIVTQNGRTLAPLAPISKELGIRVEALPEGQLTLIHTGELPLVNTLPSPMFEFKQPSYIAGQTVETTEWSYDEDGDAVTAREWMISTEPNKKTPDLQTLLKDLKPGDYQISLRVKDAKGAWSNWKLQTLTITPNQSPVVDTLTSDKASYVQGEAMSFAHTYTNEEWEAIKGENWSYYHINDPKYIIKEKPTAFYAPGTYVVSLQLTDMYGNKSTAKELKIEVTDQKLTTEMNEKFTNGEPGDLLHNFQGTNFRDYKREESLKRTENNDKLLLSNSPEVVGKKGILYAQEIEGKGRILLHHLNNFSPQDNAASKKKIMIVATNPGTKPIEITISNKVVEGGSSDPLRLGQLVVRDYFQGTAPKTYTIQPGEYVNIYETKGTAWEKDHIMTGMMDFEATGTLGITVAAVDESAKSTDIKHLSFLPKDVHPRGTYHTTEKYYDVNLTESEPTYILLGEGPEEWTTGIDVITGEISKNRGNYGITYRITITAKEDTGIILNARGGPFRGAIRWEEGPVHLIPKVGLLSENKRAAVVGVIPAGTTTTLEYMLPNGSASPILLGFVPKSHWMN